MYTSTFKTMCESFQMRYYMTFYLKGHQNYQKSWLKIPKKSAFIKSSGKLNVIQYLIWKLSQVVLNIEVDMGVAALSCSATLHCYEKYYFTS